MASIAPRRRSKRKPSLKTLSQDEKRARIQEQASRVRDAAQAVEQNLWRRADELASLVDLYRRCYGNPPSSSHLQRISGIDLNGCRLALHAKLSLFFPEELRLKGVGLRVYETAYKFNGSLKQNGRVQFTAEELVACMKSGRGSDETKYQIDHALWERDRDEIHQQRVADKELALTKPKAVVKDKKTFLRMIENAPPFAIAAAITTIHDNDTAMQSLNRTLKKLGSNYRVKRPSDMYFSTYYQPDLFDPDENYDVG
jgi:uncharacterized protein YgbK (DUF1537 family)